MVNKRLAGKLNPPPSLAAKYLRATGKEEGGSSIFNEREADEFLGLRQRGKGSGENRFEDERGAQISKGPLVYHLQV